MAIVEAMDGLMEYLSGAISLARVVVVAAFLLILVCAYANRQMTHALFWKAIAGLALLLLVVFLVLRMYSP